METIIVDPEKLTFYRECSKKLPFEIIEAKEKSQPPS